MEDLSSAGLAAQILSRNESSEPCCDVLLPHLSTFLTHFERGATPATANFHPGGQPPRGVHACCQALSALGLDVRLASF
jgi:hypothetical protein